MGFQSASNANNQSKDLFHPQPPISITKYQEPRKFMFFFNKSLADPTHDVPVVEILPGHRQVYFRDWRARLAMKLVKILLPKRDAHAQPMQTFAPYGKDARHSYMQKLCALVNQGGPHILSVGDAYIAHEPFFGVTVPVEQLGQEYGEAMLRLAYEALRARFEY